MKRQKPANSMASTPIKRCAIYTRKSSEEGLRQEFNSLDAQREAGEAYVASQRSNGWQCVATRYDDGGFSGGNVDRPGLQNLLADITADQIDIVVVYKIDRLSRSLADFMQMIAVFEKHNAAFVSVTQAFDTSSSMGRLTLNILLSFAQFEREIIGERIRDKIAASRQRGKWTGGTPVLGYDVDRSGASPTLVVNPVEAARVVEIFELYVERRSLLAVVAELNRRDWRNKAWSTRDGRPRGGLPFDKCRLHDLLTNVIYVGKTRHRDAIFPGEHEAIVSQEVFDRVQALLRRNGTSPARNRVTALLAGLLRCKACGKAMSHSFTTHKNRRYAYFLCNTRGKRGRAACLTRPIRAAEIERAVIDEIRVIARDKALIRATCQAAKTQVAETIDKLERQRRLLARSDSTDAPQQLATIDAALARWRGEQITEGVVTSALAEFDRLWNRLTPRERHEAVRLLVSRVEFDSAAGSIAITFHATGLQSLVEKSTPNTEDAA